MIKYPGKYKDLNIQKDVTHFWALVNNEVIIYTGTTYMDHRMFFGPDIEDVPERGYFIKKKNVVTCHCHVDNWLLKKLERAFDKAGLCAVYIYYSCELAVAE